MADTYNFTDAPLGSFGASQFAAAITYSFNGNNAGTVKSFIINHSVGILRADVASVEIGDNLITTPYDSIAVGVWIIPDPLNVVDLTLKRVALDTGIPLHTSAPTFIPLAGAPFYLESSGDANLKLIWI